MEIREIPTKSEGDLFMAEECNAITKGIKINEASVTSVAFLGLPAGSDITGKSISEVIELALFAEQFPTSITNPSSGFTISPSSTYQEVGNTINLSISNTFNRGTISPYYPPHNTSGYRSGPLTSYTNTGPTGTYEVILGAQSWTGRANYEAGEQPKGSKGTSMANYYPLPAGSTSVITRTIYGVYPVYACTSIITTSTKAPLQSMGTDIIVDLVAETDSDKQFVLIPKAWSTIVSLQQYNTLSGKYDNIDLTTFNKTSAVVGSLDYWLYQHNGSKIGSRKLTFKV